MGPPNWMVAADAAEAKLIGVSPAQSTTTTGHTGLDNLHNLGNRTRDVLPLISDCTGTGPVPPAQVPA